ncbi:alpha/beta fold hydrolase [Martelella radicis]|uniref:Pimeloyl-ACP methyl ester carboxylesterase/DNA-binding CsgD family transcriptional regulator n=1 Tax=Martelella radicis TaxID=1397476 RepID=A0A7W6P7L1_9HYPH|nr:alpha/beta hydrolase [Martelella radicis]MBB4120292.1 pimeloyl-ACP methyl ester carboxylesterase/DNA-binding CsgD family transcriptional regulator [Martelella radicis]
MNLPRAALRRHLSRLAEIPKLLGSAALPRGWEEDDPEIREARSQIEVQQFFHTRLPAFDMPCCLLDSEGHAVYGSDEAFRPQELQLPAVNEHGVFISEHNNDLVLLLDVSRYWSDPPPRAAWLALNIGPRFFDTLTANPETGLTNSEYSLLSSLLAGHDLKQAAERLNTSYDTKRKQLQVIFQKFEVTSQAALTRLVSTRLMAYFIETLSRPLDDRPERKLLARHYGRDVLVHAVALESGKELPVWEFGDRRGRPLVFFHGLLSPSTFYEDKVTLLRRHGLRWIVVPRFFVPGAADTHPLGFLETYSDALAEYVRHFIGEPVTCVAVNSGVSWAVHFAHRHPELASRLVIAGAPYPPSHSMGVADRSMQAALSNAIRQRPFVLSALVRSYAMLTRSPALAARAYRHAYRDCPADLATIDRYIETGWALEWLRLIGERATASVVADLAVNERGWEHEAADLQQPLAFLHGGQDTMCPPAAIARFCEGIARAELQLVPDAGHHVAASHFPRLCALAAGDLLLRDEPTSSAVPEKTIDKPVEGVTAARSGPH